MCKLANLEMSVRAAPQPRGLANLPNPPPRWGLEMIDDDLGSSSVAIRKGKLRRSKMNPSPTLRPARLVRWGMNDEPKVHHPYPTEPSATHLPSCLPATPHVRGCRGGTHYFRGPTRAL